MLRVISRVVNSALSVAMFTRKYPFSPINQATTPLAPSPTRSRVGNAHHLRPLLRPLRWAMPTLRLLTSTHCSSLIASYTHCSLLLTLIAHCFFCSLLLILIASSQPRTDYTHPYTLPGDSLSSTDTPPSPAAYKSVS